ncbi:hypothetical protein G4V62_02890 [Bacillaceae bacterium SIJ1]|uniref:hypothetical protein n=1 Tax=Litoribacterium kuwaitense TaxID=1398745 RepID=UPI0013EC98FB|nr:hypothetical protein [Litoribacterium kuwaitense]NGP43945.1 hypothetical protein [Litoribacterium kuwaitense]
MHLDHYHGTTYQLIEEIRALIRVFQDEHSEADKREVFLTINDLTIELVRREGQEKAIESM